MRICCFNYNTFYQVLTSASDPGTGVSLKMFTWCGHKLDKTFPFPVTEVITFKL